METLITLTRPELILVLIISLLSGAAISLFITLAIELHRISEALKRRTI